MKETFRHGVALAVHEVGDGRPMLFQHGLGGDARQAAEAFPEGIDWRGITVECRGHGQSEAGPLDALGFETFVRDLAAYVETQGGPVVVGGISMGAALALRLAVERPELVSGLVLARPAWLFAAGPENMAPYGLVGELLGRHPPEEARQAFDGSEMARRLEVEAPDNLASLRGMFAREPLDVTRALLTRLPADDPGVAEARARALRVATLVIGHGRDLAHPLAYAKTLAALIPGARLATITPKSDSRERHVREFRAALAQFLQEIPA